MKNKNHISLLEKRVVEQCAPTLAGLKTGSLFSLRGFSSSGLLSEICDLNRKFRSSGLLLIPLKKTEDFALLYLYRPGCLKRDLLDPDAVRIMRRSGYRSSDTSYCILRLCRRLREESAFPHEIGLFLGYPPKDVEGFIRDPNCACACKGCWKVYSEPDKAARIFERYRQCTACYLRRIKEGSSLEQLLVSGL